MHLVEEATAGWWMDCDAECRPFEPLRRERTGQEATLSEKTTIVSVAVAPIGNTCSEGKGRAEVN